MVDIIDWRFTSKCDNQCFYCYAHTNRGELDYRSKITILDKLLKNGCKVICLSGGEPMINDFECVNFINYAYNHGIKIHFSTNGLKYLKHMDKVHNKIVRLSLPLDGFNSKNNTCNGRNNKAYDTIIEILETISKLQKNPYIKINTTITALNGNLDNILRIYDVLKKYNINLWEIYEFIPENLGAKNFEMLKLNEGIFDKLKNEFNSIVKKPVFDVEFASRESRDSRYFIIQPDGNVVTPKDNGNVVEEILIGNLLENPFEEVLAKWEETAIPDLSFQKKRILQSQE